MMAQLTLFWKRIMHVGRRRRMSEIDVRRPDTILTEQMQTGAM